MSRSYETGNLRLCRITCNSRNVSAEPLTASQVALHTASTGASAPPNRNTPASSMELGTARSAKARSPFCFLGSTPLRRQTKQSSTSRPTIYQHRSPTSQNPKNLKLRLIHVCPLRAANSIGTTMGTAGRLMPCAKSSASGPGTRDHVLISLPSPSTTSTLCDSGAQGAQVIRSIATV